MKIETERSCFPVRFSPEFQTLYIAHSIKVALGIGKLLFGGHSSKALHCLICPITKATFFDLAVYHFFDWKGTPFRHLIELNSELQSPGFLILQAKISQIPESGMFHPTRRKLLRK